jgi:Ca-activated chloride channel homolog
VRRNDDPARIDLVAQNAMMTTWFATPVLLVTLLAIPVCSAFLVFAHFRRKQLTARLGNRLLLRKSLIVGFGVRRCKTACVMTGLCLVAIACAGPQWGIDRDAQHRKGRDVILVLDLSRSMSAEQPSRRELAVRSLKQLADNFEEQGGNRVALIAFASKAELLFPLTHDVGHLRHTLAQIEADDIVKLSTEEPISGTRIGAALKLAVDSYDPSRANRPIIVLLSDGDDPADDDEWQQGASAAKAKAIRVHTVGFGDPNKAENLYLGSELLRYDGKPIPTKLNEPRLRDIASHTGGVYLPAHTDAPPLGVFVQHVLDADELRDEEATEALLPVYQLRYAWFLMPAVLLFLIAMVLNEGPPMSGSQSNAPSKSKAAQPRQRAKAVSMLLAVLAIGFVSAADPPVADSFLRQGNEAFAAGDYKAALEFYEKAEPQTLDPGQVSFNKAAAYYRLDRHREAIECYRRCLQDDKAGSERRVRAHFDLGNALVQYAGDNPTTLAEAVAAYRACLYQPKLPDGLRVDARHNLELAQLLWLKAWEKLPDDKKKELTKPNEPTDKEDDDNRETKYAQVSPDKRAEERPADDLPPGGRPKTVRSDGRPQVLLDENKVMAMSPEDTLATLETQAARIAAARRQQRNPVGPATLSTKDW